MGENTEIRIMSVTTDKKQYLPLLLIGDEQESMIDTYLERGEMFVMTDAEGKTVAAAVITDEGNGILELKNLAVSPRRQMATSVFLPAGQYIPSAHTISRQVMNDIRLFP